MTSHERAGQDKVRASASREALEFRAQMLKRVRSFFNERAFTEVETPILSRDVVIDLHLDPLELVMPDDVTQPSIGERMFLQTSPEFHMKRLLLSGIPAIYQISRVFRAAEIGSIHNPEFSMVEWYRVGDDYVAGRKLLADFTKVLFGTATISEISYRDAFQNRLGINPHRANVDSLRDLAHSHAIEIPESWTSPSRDDMLDLLMSEIIQPDLGRDHPTILFDYPASQSALAKVREEEDRVAERFELFFQGIELANGYHELLDADELRRRNKKNNAQRIAAGKQELPVESHLLDAMAIGLPSCAGVALGFDRAVMVAMGAKTIREVIAFPIDRA